MMGTGATNRLVRGGLHPGDVAFADDPINGTGKLEAQFINNNRSFSFDSDSDLTIAIDWNKGDYNDIFVGGGDDGSPSGIPGSPVGGSFITITRTDAAGGVFMPSPEPTRSQVYIGFKDSRWTIDFYLVDYTYIYVELQTQQLIANLDVQGLIKLLDAVQLPVMLQNNSNGLIDNTAVAGFTAPLPCVSGVAGDFDNDMDQDIYLVCPGGVRNLGNMLFENDGNGVFTRVVQFGTAQCRADSQRREPLCALPNSACIRGLVL
jgi:hypothetical protein